MYTFLYLPMDRDDLAIVFTRVRRSFVCHSFMCDMRRIHIRDVSRLYGFYVDVFDAGAFIYRICVTFVTFESLLHDYSCVLGLIY